MIWYCTVSRIDGDYALLTRNDDPNGEPYQVARFLLPDGIEEGTQLKCENFMYSLAE